MDIIVNGNLKHYDENFTVLELIKIYSLDKDRVIFLKDDIIIPKEEYETTLLEDGNKIELLSIVGGG